jgi:hypothetical protein
MKRCKAHLVCVCLFFLVAVPLYAQRGSLGVDLGETTDKFGALPSSTGLVFMVEGQLTVLKANEKTGRPNIVAGGDIRVPSDTGKHSNEFAIFGGPEFQYHNFTFGVHAQLRKIYLPSSIVDNQIFVRYKMELLQIPVIVRYNFGTGKHAFVEAQGEPEFRPRFLSNGSGVALPHPNLDHGYTLRASAGYDFGKWYAKATYETRYLKFVPDLGNPNGLYNWKSNYLTGGVGFVF